MKNQTPNIQPLNLNETVTRTQEALQLTYKAIKAHRHAESPQKSKQLPEQPIPVIRFERLADNTLGCKVCGQKPPLTKKGEPDLELLELQMLLGQWPCH